MRVGVLGAGPIAQFAHFEALNKARNAELYATCDLAEDLLAQVDAVHRPRRTFADYAAMLADPEVDAVLIATADQFHVPAARQAIQAGKLAERAGAYCWFVGVRFADGSIGHLDLTMSVEMDWHEGFHLCGEHGSVVAKSFLPWYHRSNEVECFSSKDRQYHRPLGEDAHFWRRQVEGFADGILTGAPQLGATVDDGLATMRVMDAIEHSVESGTAVFVDRTFVPS